MCLILNSCFGLFLNKQNNNNSKSLKYYAFLVP